MIKLIEAVHLKKENLVPNGISNTTEAVKVLDDVSLEIFREETLGLIGERGSGKRAVGEIVAGLSLPDSGQIKFCGEDIAAMRGMMKRKLHGRVQIVFRDTADHLDRGIEIGKIIGKSIANCEKVQKDPKPLGMIEAMDLAGLDQTAADCRVGELETADVKRTGIALAALWRPDLIVLDEPFAHIDTCSRASMIRTLERIRDELGTAYLLLSRDLSLAKKICDRLAFIREGKIVETGRTGKIVENPETEYAREFLASEF